ncbi:MAG TPA: hypothetical protein VFV92_00010, partial [Candidatus Bathyarchaeia archaeon]|nr:hypothetical protein [Candidatus Bathyarchaeia archaeon]
QSTFDAYVGSATQEVRRRGFIVRRDLMSYYEPLGQALTAGYMRAIGISRYHWDPNIDPLCR